jgi:general secretion pathway protein K
MALLSALLAVALLSIIVVEMADSTLVHSHLSRNTGNALAAQLLARSAVAGAEAILIEDAKDDTVAVTSSDDPWALPYVVPTRNGSVAFQITDEAGKLDLNRIRESAYRPALERLFEDLEVDERLLDAVEAWTDPNPDVAARAASQYCALPMPCDTRRGPMASIDDLRLIRGFEPSILRRLRPYVTALPKGLRPSVNVNTALWQVLKAVGCDVGADFTPPPGGYTKVDDVTPCADADGRRLLGTKSDVFSIEATGNVGDLSQHVRTMVSRRGSTATTRLTWSEHPVSDLSPPEVP